MSEAAERERIVKRGWAAPGGFHDYLIRFLKVALPCAVGVLAVFLALAPLQHNREKSFLLDKSKVDVAPERMRVESARYRGQDNAGRPFTIAAASAVQPSSHTPLVDISGMTASMAFEEGPATLRADRSRYNMDTERVSVLGPILFAAADGYRLDTSDVTVDFNTRSLSGEGRVQGRMPLGTFTADRMRANLPERRVTLTGRARLHIVQGALR